MDSQYRYRPQVGGQAIGQNAPSSKAEHPTLPEIAARLSTLRDHLEDVAGLAHSVLAHLRGSPPLSTDNGGTTGEIASTNPIQRMHDAIDKHFTTNDVIREALSEIGHIVGADV